MRPYHSLKLPEKKLQQCGDQPFQPSNKRQEEMASNCKRGGLDRTLGKNS